MAKEKLYLDTSVFGGFFDSEFELWTKVLFNQISNREYEIIYSDLIDIELLHAPERVKSLIEKIPKECILNVGLSDEADALADQYIDEKVVGKTSKPDCIHIALATLHHADILVSWNFKHIVNVSRIRGYNSINYKLGHQMLEIRSPREIIQYED